MTKKYLSLFLSDVPAAVTVIWSVKELLLSELFAISNGTNAAMMKIPLVKKVGPAAFATLKVLNAAAREETYLYTIPLNLLS